MEFVKDKVFDNYIESYKKLPLEEKKNLVIDEMKKIMILLEKININENKKVLFNKEIFDINKKDSTEADFVEAVFVYINSIEELLANCIKEV